MLVNNLVLKTIYEARESGGSVAAALYNLKITRDEIKKALEYLEKEGLIEKNSSIYINGEEQRVCDKASVVTAEGLDYIQEHDL